MVKKAVIVLIILFLLGLFYSLGKQIYDSLQVNKRLDQETEELTELQKKNVELKKKLAEVQTLEFVEQQARDKLNFAREGETIVIIPQKEIEKILGVDYQEKVEELVNWQGWLQLFWK